ncbi:LamG-like jellyroll fold domain-containing protein [Vibrio maritimus]|uniref:LamG-like jellyroll fold domain-containing protein n=1 Tax=Vibrio maritimus TaxID=990268 RepID=UPI0037350254
MELKYLSIAICSASLIVGCNGSDDAGSQGGSPPISPEPGVAYDVENTFWDLETIPNSMAQNTTAAAIAYYFNSDSYQLKSYWQDGDESYYTSSNYTISGNGIDKSQGTLTFTLANIDNTCRFAVTDKQTLDLTECDNSSDVTTYKATPDKEDELNKISEKESDKDVVQPRFEWGFSTLPGGLATSGDRKFLVRNNADNPKEIVDGAKEYDAAVQITQSDSKYGFYYLPIEGAGVDELVFPDGTFSAELVFKVDNYIDLNQNLQLIELADGTSTGWKLIIDRNTLAPEARINSNTGSYTPVRAQSQIELGEYMHVVITVNSAETTIYINGEEETKRAVNFVPNQKEGDYLFLGGGSTNIQNNLEGAIDNFALFDEVLSAEQVKSRAKLFGFSTPGEVIWSANPQVDPRVEDSFKRFDAGNYPQDYCWEPGDQNGVPASNVSTFNDTHYGTVWKINKPKMRKRAEFARAEGKVNSYSAEDGDDIYIGWRWKISTEDSAEISDEVTVFQWKSADPHDQNYPLNMEYDGTLTLNAFGPSYDGTGWPSQRRAVLWRKEIPQDEWVTFVVRVKVDRQDFGGVVQFWYNGEIQSLENIDFNEYKVKLSEDRKTAFHRTGDGQFVYPKWGVYNKASCNYEINAYFDAMKIGTNFDIVQPR